MAEQEYRLAVMGSWEAVAAFQALGVDAIALQDPKEALGLWESLKTERYAVVMITEPAYLVLKEKEASFPPVEGLPVVLVVPEVGKGKGVGAAEMSEIVLRAVGSIVE